jgi:hypothetical protein
MSISRKCSFETVVVEKARDDPLQFISNPDHCRKDLDLRGLSDSANKSLKALKPWQSATVCFHHPSVSSTISKVVERVDECHGAIRTTLAVAQMGHSFADDLAALCDILGQKQESPERLDELFSKLITTAEKGYGRSIQAQGQLICVRLGLSQISESIPSQVSKIQEDTPNRQAENTTYAAFNGINTCFVTLVPSATTDIEETDIWKAPTTWPSYAPNSYLTFQNVITQLNSIAADISQFTEQVSRCVEWWSRTKSGLEMLKIALPTINQDGQHSLQMRMSNSTEGWQGVADQFALYVYKTSPVVKDYTPNPYVTGNYGMPYHGPYITQVPSASPHYHRRRSRSPVCSSRRLSTPSPVLVTRDLPQDTDTVVQEEKTKPLWKRLSCVS